MPLREDRLLLFHAFNPIVGLIINVVSQILLFRFNTKIGLLRSVTIAFLIGITGLCMMEFYYYQSHSWDLIEFSGFLFANILSYFALGYCYFHFINLGETARRIRLIRELYDAKEGLTRKEILTKYNAHDILKIRLKRLLSKDQLIIKDGRFYIGKRTVLLMSNALVILKLLLLGKKSEFD